MSRKAPLHPHVLRWVREQLGLTQAQVAEMVSCSTATIQSVELQRLALSEKFAYRLQQELRLPAKWLLANNWDDLPDPAQLRENFENAWRYGFDQSYPHLLVSRLWLLRIYVTLRAVIEELGYEGANATGFNKILRQAQSDLLGTIADKTLRQRIYEQVGLEKTGNPLNVLKIVTNDCRDLREMLTEGEKREKEKRERSPLRDPDKIDVSWDRKKDRAVFFDPKTEEPLAEAEVLKPDYKCKSYRGANPPPNLPEPFRGYWKPNIPTVIFYDLTGKVVEVSFVLASFG